MNSPDGYSIEEIQAYIAECLRDCLSSFVNQPMSKAVKQDMIRACQEAWAKAYVELFGLLEYICRW